MAIDFLNAQGTVMYILDETTMGTITGTPATDIPIIQGGDEVGCPQSIGALEETRGVTEYKCISSNDSVKSLGSISRGNTVIGLLFNPDDITGQDALQTAFELNTPVGVGIEFPNSAGVSGTILYFEGAISAVSTGIEQDSAVTYDVTIEIASAITEYEPTTV